MLCVLIGLVVEEVDTSLFFFWGGGGRLGYPYSIRLMCAYEVIDCFLLGYCGRRMFASFKLRSCWSPLTFLNMVIGGLVPQPDVAYASCALKLITRFCRHVT